MGVYETKLRNFYSSVDGKCPTIARYSRNLSLCYLDGKLGPCYHREEIITVIQKLLLRKSKPNVLLTGVAGCGKTAIAEGLAAVITEGRLQYAKNWEKADRAYRRALEKWTKEGQKGEAPVFTPPVKPPLCDHVLYDLSLNALVSGAKYRGDFEDRMEALLRESKANPKVILFVDEVHQIDSVGRAEGCSSAAQILKPALARDEVRLIGATTDEEKEQLLRDKAFARRFSQLEIPMLTGAAALETAEGILAHYSACHKVTTKVPAAQLLEQIRYYLPETVFPDNFINVVDETMAGAVFDREASVGMTQFMETLSRMSGHVILYVEDAA